MQPSVFFSNIQFVATRELLLFVRTHSDYILFYNDRRTNALDIYLSAKQW